MKLSEIKNGNTFRIGEFTIIKLFDNDGKTTVIFADTVFDSEFGNDNNFAKSVIVKRLNKEILPKIIENVGEENVFEFETDLTSLDGLKTHGVARTKITLPTLELYRNNIEIFDKYKLDSWWWLATPDSTNEHYNNNWILCVSPGGNINVDFFYDDNGVRPVLILDSSISVSCEE